MSKVMTDDPVFRLVLQDPESDRIAVGRFGDGTVVLCTTPAGVALRGVAVEDLISALDGGAMARELEEARQELGRLRARAEALETVLGLLVQYGMDEVVDSDHPLWTARMLLGQDGRSGARDVRSDGTGGGNGLSPVPVVLAVDPGVQVEQEAHRG